MQIKPVILCGGSGSRLWPLSRQQYPKQLIAFDSDHSLLQLTAERARAVSGSDAMEFICNEEYRFLVAEQLRELGGVEADIILEPCARNTAPAIALSAFRLLAEDPLLLVMPSDHVITDTPAFKSAVAAATDLAAAGNLVTFGIPATAPETGYGYIRRGEVLEAGHRVERFVEKPDAATAQAYVDDGGYYWNAGIFMFRASVFLKELQRYHPDMHSVCEAAVASIMADLDFHRVPEAVFSTSPADSVDYAVMEKTDRAAVVPLDAGWTDVGSYDALWDVAGKDEAGNAVSGDVMALDTSNSYLHSSGRLVATLGLTDAVVIETADAVLVTNKSRSQDIKQLVEKLKTSGRSERDNHQRVYRPWGFYNSIEASERYQVKLIEVSPGASLSLQMHHHRAEHWIVVSGTAQVTCGDNTFQLTENESTYIPIGCRHRLENPGRIPLRLIEVQSGSYLGEDDIVRFDDIYGRSEQQ